VGDHESSLEVKTFEIRLMYSTLYGRYSLNMVVLNRLVKLSLQKFASKEKAEDIESFFNDKDVKGFDMGLRQVLQSSIKANLCRALIW
jgi:hypothetical protein